MTKYVFLPDRGGGRVDLRVTLNAVSPTLMALAGSHGRRRPRNVEEPGIKVIDVFEPTGAALVEGQGEGVPAPERTGGKLYPVINYRMAIAEPRAGRMRMRPSAGPSGAGFFELNLRSAADGSAVVGAVAGIRPKGSQIDMSGVSDASGRVVFGFRAQVVHCDLFTVEPGFGGHWGYFERKGRFNSGMTVEIEPVDLSRHVDALRSILPGAASANEGAGVVVGVVDTGVGPHQHLTNAIGDADTTHGHGTHVAGIIAGRGPGAYRGVAPGATLRSYRVFDEPVSGVARNYEIHMAIERAVADGCHLINLSLKNERTRDPRYDDPVLGRAIEDAANRGVLIVAAAGNDFRRFVAFPARHPDVLAVSAIGSDGGLPPRAFDRWTMSRDRGRPQAAVFFASFSNQGVDGTEVTVTAPGAGIVSTVPGDRYAPMSGTSMACPAATGAIARLLSRHPEILKEAATRTRWKRMRELALANLTRFGFVREHEGNGMIA